MTFRTVTRRRIRRASGSRRADLLIAGAAALLIAALLVLGATVQRGLPGADYYDLRATFADAANLGRHAEVRIAGKRVGQVLEVRPEGGGAQVGLQLDRDIRPLRVGTRARIRLKGLLGAKYVELVPAPTGAALPDGAFLPTRATSTTVELDDIFASLDAPRRRALGSGIDSLGAGFLGRGEDLNEALGMLPRSLGDLNSVSAAINDLRGAAERLAPGLAAAAEAVEPAAQDFADGWDPSARALAPLADREEDVRALLDVAPGALRASRDGLAATDPLLAQTARLARAIERVTGPAPAALRQTAALLRDARRPLVQTRELLGHARAAVDPTVRLTDSARPLLEPLTRGLREAVPTLDVIAERRCDLLGLARNWRSMLAFGTDRGAAIGPETGLRVTVVAEPSELVQTVADLPQLVDRGSSYPPPCALGPVTPMPKDGR